MEFQKLLLSCGGGVAPRRWKMKEPQDAGAILIGLGGMGVQCLRVIKTYIHERVSPDSDSLASDINETNRRVRFLGVSANASVKSEIISLFPDDFSENDELSEISDRHVKIAELSDQEFLLMDFKAENERRIIPDSNSDSQRVSDGVSQSLLDMDAFRNRMEREILQLRELQNNMDIAIYIFAGFDEHFIPVRLAGICGVVCDMILKYYPNVPENASDNVVCHIFSSNIYPEARISKSSARKRKRQERNAINYIRALIRNHSEYDKICSFYIIERKKKSEENHDDYNYRAVMRMLGEHMSARCSIGASLPYHEIDAVLMGVFFRYFLYPQSGANGPPTDAKSFIKSVFSCPCADDISADDICGVLFGKILGGADFSFQQDGKEAENLDGQYEKKLEIIRKNGEDLKKFLISNMRESAKRIFLNFESGLDVSHDDLISDFHEFLKKIERRAKDRLFDWKKKSQDLKNQISANKNGAGKGLFSKKRYPEKYQEYSQNKLKEEIYKIEMEISQVLDEDLQSRANSDLEKTRIILRSLDECFTQNSQFLKSDRSYLKIYIPVDKFEEAALEIMRKKYDEDGVRHSFITAFAEESANFSEDLEEDQIADFIKKYYINHCFFNLADKIVSGFPDCPPDARNIASLCGSFAFEARDPLASPSRRERKILKNLKSDVYNMQLDFINFKTRLRTLHERYHYNNDNNYYLYNKIIRDMEFHTHILLRDAKLLQKIDRIDAGLKYAPYKKYKKRKK